MTGFDLYANGLRIPWSMISEELEGLYGATLLSEFSEIIGYYDIYENGADFVPETNKSDMESSTLRFREGRKLINREARFLFSKHPDMMVNVPFNEDTDDEEEIAEIKQESSILQSYLDKVLKDTNFYSKLVKAAKDCFIGKRVAYFVNFDENNHRITVDFVPSLGFVFETDPNDSSRVTKIVAFYTTVDSQNKNEQRIYKKKYWLEDDGKCWLEEYLYNGVGEVIETITPARPTKFVDVIPAGVIINDGLTGDLDGVSEIEELKDTESWYSRLANGDIDAERGGMNPVRYLMDVAPHTSKNLSLAPGALWDLQSDINVEGASGTVGMLEPNLTYQSAVSNTLSRFRSAMFESLDIPDVSSDAMRGVVSSGKTLRAIYWSLIVRCDEKMLAWRPALENIIRLIIEGGKMYAKSASRYIDGPIPDSEYDITVENQYPIPDDEVEEKQIDLQEVGNQVMSKLSYMKKWRGLTDAEAMQELRQIAQEREMLEDSYGYDQQMGMDEGAEDDAEDEEDESPVEDDDPLDDEDPVEDDTAVEDNELEENSKLDAEIDDLLKKLDSLM